MSNPIEVDVMAAHSLHKARARIEKLEQALREIADRHIGDQPAALDLDGEQWAWRCHNRLRAIARAALAQTGEPTG